MIAWSRRRTLIAGTALILVVNAVALAGVAYNRSGQADSVLSVTQRELELPYRWQHSEENSGIVLNLRWRVPAPDDADSDNPASSHEYFGGSTNWLDEAKLAALGFDVSEPLAAHYGRPRLYNGQPAKEVLLVLELNGPAYRQALARAQQHAARAQGLDAANPGVKELEQRAKSAKDRAASEEHERSRLFVVDAGLDVQALRAKYPDRARYAIVYGQVRVHIIGDRTEKRLAGYVSELNVDRVNVPIAFRDVLERSLQNDRGASKTSARYEATLAFGRRLEPWIMSLLGTTGPQ